MKAVPWVPTYTSIDVTALENTDWTDQATAGAALKALQTTLDNNSKKRTDFLTASEEAAVERIKIMQDGVEAEKKRKSSPSEIDNDTKLKAVRDEVKTMLNNAANGEKTYFDAMGAYRNRKLDFAGNFDDYLKTMRVQNLDKDKAVSGVPGKLKALEGFASGLIKEIREHRGAVVNNTVRLKKIEAASKKAVGFKDETSTSLKKILSAVNALKAKLGDPNALSDMKVKLQDLKNHNERFAKMMGAILTLKSSIEVMKKSFTGYGFESSAKPHLEAVEKVEKELINERDEVAKKLKEIRKEKALPSEIKTGLPEKL
jgi:hypothetical protein